VNEQLSATEVGKVALPAEQKSRRRGNSCVVPRNLDIGLDLQGRKNIWRAVICPKAALLHMTASDTSVHWSFKDTDFSTSSRMSDFSTSKAIFDFGLPKKLRVRPFLDFRFLRSESW